MFRLGSNTIIVVLTNLVVNATGTLVDFPNPQLPWTSKYLGAFLVDSKSNKLIKISTVLIKIPMVLVKISTFFVKILKFFVKKSKIFVKISKFSG